MSITDLYQTELWADGMQVDFAKLNNMQRFPGAAVTDQIVQALVGGVANSGITMPEFGGQNGANPPTIWAYAVSVGGAYLRQGSANNKIQIAPGTLFQKIANSDGQGPTFVPFTFDGTSAGEFTLTNGDPTNPRVDLLQMQLQYASTTPASVDFQDAVSRAMTTVASTSTRRQLQCTLSVKQGTPAASPRIPDPDTGFCAVGSVVVGNGWATGGNAPIFGVDTAATNNAVVHDQRMPIAVSGSSIQASNYLIESNWSVTGFGDSVLSSTSSNSLYVVNRLRPGRVIGIGVSQSGVAFTSSTSFGTWRNGAFVKGHTVSATSTVNSMTNVSRVQFEASHSPSAGPTILSSTTNSIGVPLWTSGYRTPNPDTTAISAFASIHVLNASNASVISETTFYIARGI